MATNHASAVSDVTARYGGEAFAILMPHTDGFGALMMAEQVRGAVLDRDLPHQGSPYGIVSVSIGSRPWSRMGTKAPRCSWPGPMRPSARPGGRAGTESRRTRRWWLQPRRPLGGSARPTTRQGGRSEPPLQRGQADFAGAGLERGSHRAHRNGGQPGQGHVHRPVRRVDHQGRGDAGARRGCPPVLCSCCHR